ncbi:hypothetical protein COY17_02550 [Candidatus Saccharibacteria bacterium CG_4_10_14_0_2_um_filter_52_9]|nr:MAG: hypothetical protein COY17_02550 [Candidatus Saccharibacteria bacterium CG_4_10_14_0_2_um_filter_52_9]
MKKQGGFWKDNINLIIWSVFGIALVLAVLLYQLGSLTGGLSTGENVSAVAPVGWHGIFNDPLYLPLKIVRSAVYFVAPGHGQILTRLPNVIFGGLAVSSFTLLILLWHGRRTALFTGLLFATSAWVLHVSRLASFDVLYLWVVPTMLLLQVLLHRYGERSAVWYGSLLTWGLLLYIPGLVWLVAAQILLQWKLVVHCWQVFSHWWQRLLAALSVLIWLPLLAIDFTRHGQLITWLGLPSQWPSIAGVAKQFALVPVHLLVHGPTSPTLWLDQAPILDIFTLVVCGLGIYFYASHWRSSRTKSLTTLILLSGVLVGLGGSVGLSLLVPFLYIAAATGIAYLLRDWLKVFPLNPLARGLGIGLVSLAVLASCTYNLRSYFIAWPHNNATQTVFHYHR